MDEEINTFAAIDEPAGKSSAQTSAQSKGEINLDDFSDTAVGERTKYIRPDLDGKTDVIEKFQVFLPDSKNEPAQMALSGNTKYWKVTMILTYASKNEDDVNNREYISGARCFEQKDGGMSEISFWYKGCDTQSGLLWERVAAKLDLAPEDLSPRQFVAFLNNKSKVKIVGTEYKNFGAADGGKAKVKKNMPEFI